MQYLLSLRGKKDKTINATMLKNSSLVKELLNRRQILQWFRRNSSNFHVSAANVNPWWVCVIVYITEVKTEVLCLDIESSRRLRSKTFSNSRRDLSTEGTKLLSSSLRIHALMKKTELAELVAGSWRRNRRSNSSHNISQFKRQW